MDLRFLFTFVIWLGGSKTGLAIDFKEKATNVAEIHGLAPGEAIQAAGSMKT